MGASCAEPDGDVAVSLAHPATTAQSVLTISTVPNDLFNFDTSSSFW
jgi:hypothetical protein